jgi:hypothetical protein
MKGALMNTIPRAALVILLMALPLLSACSASSDTDSDRDKPPRQLSVRVYYTDSTTPNVLVNVPLRAVTTAIRIASIARAFDARIEIGDHGEGLDRTVRLNDVDLKALREAILAMEPGPVMRIEEGGERVEIWID